MLQDLQIAMLALAVVQPPKLHDRNLACRRSAMHRLDADRLCLCRLERRSGTIETSAPLGAARHARKVADAQDHDRRARLALHNCAQPLAHSLDLGRFGHVLAHLTNDLTTPLRFEPGQRELTSPNTSREACTCDSSDRRIKTRSPPCPAALAAVHTRTPLRSSPIAP